MKLLHKIRLGLLKLLKGIPDEVVPNYKVIQTTLPIKWVSREAYIDIGTLNLASDSKRLEDELIDTFKQEMSAEICKALKVGKTLDFSGDNYKYTIRVGLAFPDIAKDDSLVEIR